MQYGNSKVLYQFRAFSSDNGTMAVNFMSTGTGTRSILSNEGLNGSTPQGNIFNLYIDANNCLGLSMRDNSGNLCTPFSSQNIKLENGKWYFTAITWEWDPSNSSILDLYLYLNDKCYKASISNYKDFTDGYTALGTSVTGGQPLQGYLRGLSHSDYFSDYDAVMALYGKEVSYKYDGLSRLISQVVNTGKSTFETTYEYCAGDTSDYDSNVTTTRVKSMLNNNQGFNYSYDRNGNITEIRSYKVDYTGKSIDNNDPINYHYDELNELIREDNSVLGKTIVYTYDRDGNMTAKTEYPYTTGNLGTSTATYKYTYGDSNWADKLTAYNGKTISYDAIGNPTSYNGWSFAWQQGRQLQSMNGNGYTIGFKYNDSGIRTSKTVNGVTTNYYLDGDKVICEDTNGIKTYYTYDSTGKLISMNYSGANYYYVRNAQGDIIALIDENGNRVANYTYDSWGKLISIKDQYGNNIADNPGSIGNVNPYRYRGYRYDTETGLYYLNSRYYNPEWGRFINADSIVGQTGELLSHNMFAYCSNNPIIRADEGGYFWNIIIGAAVGGLIGGLTSVVTQYMETGSINWKSVLVSTGTGVLSGALAASGFGLAGQILGNALISGVQYTADAAVNGETFNALHCAAYVGIGGASGLIGGRGLLSSKGDLAPVLEDTETTIERELRRGNTKYAWKAINKAAENAANVYRKEAFKAFGRYCMADAFSAGADYLCDRAFSQSGGSSGIQHCCCMAY